MIQRTPSDHDSATRPTGRLFARARRRGPSARASAVGASLVAAVALGASVLTGGPLAMPDAAHASASLPTPDRLAGDDRYETAVAVSRHGYPTGADVVYVASGTRFADGLAAAPAAAREGAPLLLTTADRLPSAVVAEIERLSPERVVVIGSEPSVSARVAAQLDALAGSVERIGGSDRYETSRLIAQHAFDGADHAFIATGLNYPDALSAGPAAGSLDAPILLVDGRSGDLGSATRSALEGLGARAVHLQGDADSVSRGIESDLRSSGFELQRFAGSDRFQTALMVNQAFFRGSAPAMYLASGSGFADALSASALAAAQGAPLYLAHSSCVSGAVVDEGTRLQQPPVFLLGSEQTLSSQVAAYETCAGTSAPAPAPAPAPATGVPGPDNTGVPAGVSLRVHSGNMVITEPGTVIDGLDIRGYVNVRADNVTIRNSIVRGGAVGAQHSIVQSASGGSVTIVDSELVAANPNPDIDGIRGSNITVERTEIRNVIDGVHIYGAGNVTVRSSWIHDLLHYENDPNHSDGSHNDGVQIQSGSNISFSGNRIEDAHTAGIIMTQDAGDVSNVRIAGNWLDGGGCTVNISEKSYGPLRGIVLADNTFGSNSTFDCQVIYPATSDVTMTGNVTSDGSAMAIVRR